jgi:hypothetical protein
VFQRLLAPIKDRFVAQDFENLVHESRFQSSNGKYQVAQMQEYSSDLDSAENKVGLVEWTKNTKYVGCQWVNKKVLDKRYAFDVSKWEKIIYLQLQEKP